MKKLIVILLLSVVGCSTKQAMERVNKIFVGKHINEFVLKYGFPYNTHELLNGDFLYTWSSGTTSYQMPTVTTTSGRISPYGSYSGTAITTGGGSIDLFCMVQLRTTKEGKILKIKAVSDTGGRWTASRCFEVLD